MPNRYFFTSRGTYEIALYSDVIHSFDWKSAVEHDGGVLKCVIVYLARDIPVFVMYCVYGTSRSSLLIESTDSMIYRKSVPLNTPEILLRYNCWDDGLGPTDVLWSVGISLSVQNHNHYTTAKAIYIPWHRREKSRVCSADDS